MNGFAIILAKIGACLEIRRQTLHQPQQLQIAVAFLLQSPTRTNLIVISVDVQFEQITRMVGLAAGDQGLCLTEIQCLLIQGVHKGIDHPYRMILANIVIQSVR